MTTDTRHRQIRCAALTALTLGSLALIAARPGQALGASGPWSGDADLSSALDCPGLPGSLAGLPPAAQTRLDEALKRVCRDPLVEPTLGQGVDLGVIGGTTATASAADGGGASRTYHLCGGRDGAVERAIEQQVAGRGFSATLTSTGGGCADLIIAVPDDGVAVRGGSSQSTSLSVGVGSGGRVSIEIVSRDGQTQARTGS